MSRPLTATPKRPKNVSLVVIQGAILDKDSRTYNFLTNIFNFKLKLIYLQFDILTVRDNFLEFLFSKIAVTRNNVVDIFSNSFQLTNSRVQLLFLSFKLNVNETAAARAQLAVRTEIATGGMRTVKVAQTVLLTIDNEIQNTNATFTAFVFRFILIIFLSYSSSRFSRNALAFRLQSGFIQLSHFLPEVTR